MQLTIFARYASVLSLVFTYAVSTSGAVRINELCAESSDRLLNWSDANKATLGTGLSWYEAGYDAGYWHAGSGPIGFGASGISTSLTGEMTNNVSCYMRQTFSATSGQAASGENLILEVDYDDGCVVYLNGTEVLRKNAGSAGAFMFHDQPAFNTHPSGSTETYTLGVAGDLLLSGDNLLAVQVHNRSVGDGPLKMSAKLRMGGGTVLAPETGPWAYLPGNHEPSGGVVDTSWLTSHAAIPTYPWTLPDFDDATWLQGAGGIGYGDGDDSTDVELLVRNLAWSVYSRGTFTLDSEAAGSTDDLTFTVDYDDGFVAYLNGHEIARRGLGSYGDFVPHDAGATGHEAGTPETITVSDASQYLLVGENVLAVQLHNETLGSSDMTMLANLDLTGAPVGRLVDQHDDWNYFIGTEEPSELPESIPQPEDTSDFVDWIELVNTSSVPVALQGWGLTDDAGDPHKWVLPNLTLQPGEHKLILCTGLDIAEPTAPFLHANFKLGRTGEYVGLCSSTGAVVSEIAPEYPEQKTRYTYGWDTAAGAYRYHKTATPGQPNSGDTFEQLPAVPNVLPASGFYDSSVTVEVTATGAVAQVYYTTDGRVPSPSQGTLYVGTFILNDSTAVRMITVNPEGVVSDPVTRNYLINEPAAVQSLPAICLTADWETGLHKPHGITSIVGGEWVSDTGYEWDKQWEASGPDDYNIPVQRGRPYERRVHLDLMYPDSMSKTNYQSDCGMRIAGSDYSRPRFQFQDLNGLWNDDPHVDKVQVNLFFRDAYGDKRFEHPIFRGSESSKLKSLRIRSGKNDWYNPFIVDEFMRRTLQDSGVVTSVGVLSTVFVNGELRNYYNPTPRYDETFFQQAYGSAQDFDVVGHGGVADGDDIAFEEMSEFFTPLPWGGDLSDPDSYQEAARYVDIENLIDYLIVNCYGATWDWPGNNWAASRERSALGRWRFHMWDAEGALGVVSGRNPLTYNTLASDFMGQNEWWPISRKIFLKLIDSDQFKQHWYDRAWLHLSEGGALHEDRLMVRLNELADEMDPMMVHMQGWPTDRGVISDWITKRREPLIQQFRDAGLWFDIAPPLFSVPGGTATNGLQVGISHANGSGTIYYSMDGSDPRGPGGVVAGVEYTGPLTIDRSRHVKARVLSGGVWGALGEETYVTDHPKLVISEIMYHPADPPVGSPYTAADFEFIELYNAEGSVLPLSPVYIDIGISYNFAGGDMTEIQPGQYIVLVKNPAAFASRYGTQNITVAGIFTGKFSDSGEPIALKHAHYGLLMFGSYSDGWYDHTDGEGYSLTLRNLSAPGVFGEKGSWKPSSVYGGTPGQPDPDSVPEPGQVVVNELLSHTDASPVGDWIEIHNTTDEPIDLSDWTLSDDGTNLAKYVISAGTILPANGYLVFNAMEHFDHASAVVPFSFSEHGDEAILTSPAAGGELTGYRNRVDFNGADREVTFGRHVRSDGKTDWTALSASSPLGQNAYPIVGPLVLVEVHAEPTAGGQEYIQFYNMTDTELPLFDPLAPTNVWSIVGGIEYVFPPNSWIPAHEGLIVTGGDPAAFRAAHGVPTEKPVLGPFSGALANEGDAIKVYRPGVPDADGVPRIRSERLDYNDKFPWPIMPVGGGVSLIRNQMTDYGNDPANWSLGVVLGGPAASTRVDSDADGIPDRWEAAHSLQYLQSGDALLDSDFDGMNNLDEYIAGTSPVDSNSVFMLGMTVIDGGAAVVFDSIAAEGDGYDGVSRYYTLLHAEEPGGAFMIVPGHEAMDAAGETIAVTNLPTGTNGFFRGQVELAPAP